MSMSLDELHEAILRGLHTLGLELSDVNSRKTAQYAALLHKWNKTYNLTAVREIERVIPLHLLDSLAIAPWLDESRLLDVGSGAGLPGIPLAIARPTMMVTTLDSNSKKTAFQQQAVIELSLMNLSVITSRVDTYCPGPIYGQIVSRAFSEMTDFVQLTRHLLAPGGHWLAMKGVRPDAEIARLPPWATVEKIVELSVPGVDGERHLVVLKQITS